MNLMLVGSIGVQEKSLYRIRVLRILEILGIQRNGKPRVSAVSKISSMRRSISVKADVAAVCRRHPVPPSFHAHLLLSPLFGELGAVWGPSSRTLQSPGRPRGPRHFPQSFGLGGPGYRCR